MKAIIDSELLPKMLRVNSDINKAGFNKFLMPPFVEGEIVKVNQEQLPHPKSNLNVNTFRKNYVSIIRKDENGAWNSIQTMDWKFFEKIGKK